MPDDTLDFELDLPANSPETRLAELTEWARGCGAVDTRTVYEGVTAKTFVAKFRDPGKACPICKGISERNRREDFFRQTKVKSRVR